MKLGIKLKAINTLALLWVTAGFILPGCTTDASPTDPSTIETCKLEGKIIKVTDGDTVHVLDDEQQTHKIRLAGIDAPELGQAYGQAARKFLAKQVNQKTVCVDWHKRDKYQRLVGVIKYEGRDVNLNIVKAGYAWHYKKYQKEQTPPDRILYAQAETEARSDVIGLWSEPDPIKPTDWRKGKKERAKAAKPKVLAPEDFTCGTKRFCGQMGSCAEACFHLQQCGLARLDGNSDGIPCSQKCNKKCKN